MYGVQEFALRVRRVTGPAQNSFVFFEVMADGQVLSDRAEPFHAGTHKITLWQCDECGRCGTPSVTAWRIDQDYVIWDVFDEQYTLPSGGRTYQFCFRTYRELLGGNADDLPLLKNKALLEMAARIKIPPWRQAIYIEPSVPGDVDGKAFLRCLAENWEQGAIRPVTRRVMPGATYEIGIDAKDFYAFTFEVGGVCKVPCVMRFLENPVFPVWVEVGAQDVGMRDKKTADTDSAGS